MYFVNSFFFDTWSIRQRQSQTMRRKERRLKQTFHEIA